MLHWSWEKLRVKFICGHIKFVKYNDGQKNFGEFIYGDIIITFIASLGKNKYVLPTDVNKPPCKTKIWRNNAGEVILEKIIGGNIVGENIFGEKNYVQYMFVKLAL